MTALAHFTFFTTLGITCVHVVSYFSKVLQTSEGISEPLMPFVSFPVCILRITNYLTGTLKHNACRFIGEFLKGYATEIQNYFLQRQ